MQGLTDRFANKEGMSSNIVCDIQYGELQLLKQKKKESIARTSHGPFMIIN